MKVGSDIRDSAIRAAMADMVNAVAGLKQSGHVELSEALKRLVERVVECEILPQTRQEIIEDLLFVGQQASLRPEQRKRGVVKAVLAYVKHTMQTVQPLTKPGTPSAVRLKTFSICSCRPLWGWRCTVIHRKIAWTLVDSVALQSTYV